MTSLSKVRSNNLGIEYFYLDTKDKIEFLTTIDTVSADITKLSKIKIVVYSLRYIFSHVYMCNEEKKLADAEYKDTRKIRDSIDESNMNDFNEIIKQLIIKAEKYYLTNFKPLNLVKSNIDDLICEICQLKPSLQAANEEMDLKRVKASAAYREELLIDPSADFYFPEEEKLYLKIKAYEKSLEEKKTYFRELQTEIKYLEYAAECMRNLNKFHSIE